MDFKRMPVRISFRTGQKLTFGKLKAFPGALLPVLLPFLDSGITCNQPGMFKCRSQIPIELNECARYAMTDRASLSCGSAAIYVYQYVELIGCFRKLQGLSNYHSKRLVREISLERLAVYNNLSRARS
jgi:hypothetical protein